MSNSTMHRNKRLEPHSKEWFNHMWLVNPVQAIMARYAVQHAKTTRCCSICGSINNIADYIVLNSDDTSLLARLCSDCRERQHQQFGLETTPYEREVSSHG